MFQPILFAVLLGMASWCWADNVASRILEKPLPARIISTDAGVTALLFELGLEKQLVAVDVTSHLPPDHDSIVNIGYHRQLSAEGLLSLRPDLVIGSEHMGPQAALDALSQARVQRLQLPTAYDVAALQYNIRQIAQQMNQVAQGEKLVTRLQQRMAPLQSLKQHPPLRYVFLMQMDQRSVRYAGGKTGGDALIKLLEGINLGEHVAYRDISAEGLLAMNPDVILVASRDANDDAAQSLLAQYPVLLQTQAGQSEKIINVDGSALVAGLSVLTVDEALRLAERVRQ